MISETAFENIQENARLCKYSSLNYTDYDACKSADVLFQAPDAVLLHDSTVTPPQLYFAADDFDLVLRETNSLKGPLRMNFAPYEHLQTLIEAGFDVFAEFVDYFLPNLKDASVATEQCKSITYMKQAECEAASILSRRCAGQSRGFCGEPLEFFSEWMNEGNYVMMIRCQNGIAGFCCVSIYGEGTTLWIRELAVDPACQGLGYGKKLVEQAIAYGMRNGAVKAFLAVDTMNHNAISIYKRYGFAQRGVQGELQMIRR